MASRYVTPQGMFLLNQELSQRWLHRRQVVKALAAAAAEGDRSENAEYIYRKKQLRELDRRIRYLQKRLPDLQVVDRKPDNTDQVFFAARVLLELADGSQLSYRIVGPDEIDHAKGNISVDSPLARALLGKQVDDEVTATVPDGEHVYYIAKVSYEQD